MPTASSDGFTHSAQGHLHVSHALGRRERVGESKSIRCMKQTGAADSSDSQLGYWAGPVTTPSLHFLTADVGIIPLHLR